MLLQWVKHAVHGAVRKWPRACTYRTKVQSQTPNPPNPMLYQSSDVEIAHTSMTMMVAPPPFDVTLAHSSMTMMVALPHRPGRLQREWREGNLESLLAYTLEPKWRPWICWCTEACAARMLKSTSAFCKVSVCRS